MNIISMVSEKLIGPKKRWRAYKARVQQLPANYRGAVEAVERYLLYLGPGDGEGAATMFEDLADLFERAAADGTPIRELVGAEPVEFADAFMANYPAGQWRIKEQDRLINGIKRAAGEAGGGQKGTN